MHVVGESDEIEGAKREALASFGDDRVLDASASSRALSLSGRSDISFFLGC
jgi:hypothetical protein